MPAKNLAKPPKPERDCNLTAKSNTTLKPFNTIEGFKGLKWGMKECLSELEKMEIKPLDCRG
jgi:hypothetical protein